MISSHPVTALSYASHHEMLERMAPHYREASRAQKTLLLDRVGAITGYIHTYAICLLNHPVQGKRAIQRPRQPRYNAQVQHALVFAWKAARQICAKRQVPFLPTCVATLEQPRHLQLTQEDRGQLLRMSASTAERFLHSQRKPTPRSLSITHAGPLLKHRIPLRTFHQPYNLFSCTKNSLSFQFCMNARTSITTPILMIRIFNTLCKELVLLLFSAFPSSTLIVVPVL